MKSPLLGFSFCALLAAAPLTAQVQDVGLTMDGGVLTVIYGQVCGPVSCTPFVGGNVAGGETRSLIHYSHYTSLYVIAVGNPGPCLNIPGFDNPLLLADPFVLGFGLTSSPPFVPLPCQQGIAGESLSLPVGTPPGIVFRVQSLGVSPSTGNFAFGPAIEATTI